MNLVVDAGNTRVKYAFFEEEENRPVDMGFGAAAMLERVVFYKEQEKRIDLLLTGSGVFDGQVGLSLKKLADSCMEADMSTSLPVTIGYGTPETLGFDRIAVCVGAESLFPQKNLLVIDSGTAITFNYMDEQRCFIGGNISPGLEMRFKALHQFTAKLPYVHADARYGGIGRTTEEAIRNGVMDGMLFEVKGYIDIFFRQKENARVLITGGNSCFLKGRLSDVNVYFDDYLGVVGLNSILKYNKKQG